jgi:hypothetical protein
MILRTLAWKPAKTAAASVLVLLALGGCSPLLRAPYYAPTAYEGAAVYQPPPAYQQAPVYQPAPASSRPYYYGQQPPHQPAPAALFEPPPGPITDFCASELQERLATRNALIAKGAVQPYITAADRKVRRTWDVCQKQYLLALEKRANAHPSAEPVPAPTPPQADQPVAEAAQPDGGSAQQIDPSPPVAEGAADQPAPSPPPPEPEAHAADQATAAPRPVKLTPAQRKAVAEREEKRKAEVAEREEKRRAERAAKKAEKEERVRQAKAAAEELVRAYCGPEPERSAWDGTYEGVERYFKKIANDPDSVDFAGCTPMVLKGPPKCWVTVCNVRAKNGFGAKILRALAFSKSSEGWTDLSD